MKRSLTMFILALGFLSAGCGEDSTPVDPGPTAQPTVYIFSATALPANEIPAIANAENTGRGFVSATLTVTRDGSGNITSGKLNYGVTVVSFPDTTNFNNMHIHEGNSTTNGPVRIQSGLASGEVTVVNGGAVIQKNNNDVSAALAQALISNPAGFYFNLHSTLNPGGVCRGQMVLTSAQ